VDKRLLKTLEGGVRNYQEINYCICYILTHYESVVPEKIYTHPTEELSTIQTGREKFFSDNSRCIMILGGRGINF
jgi:hypothetical protein